MSARMNRHVVRLLLALYPKAWRDRYGAEAVRLTEELIAAGETTPARGALNLAAAAAAERGRALAEPAMAISTAVAMTVAALIAVAGSYYATSHAGPPGTSAAPGAPPARARLARFVCAVPAGAVTAPRLRPASAQPRRQEPGRQEPGRQRPGWKDLCVMMPPVCRTEARPRGPLVSVTVKPGQCVLPGTWRAWGTPGS